MKNIIEGVPHEPRLKNGTKAFDLTSLELCGAKTRKGAPCRRYAKLNTGRCKFHGGLSTGPKSSAGKQAAAKANLKHGYYSEEKIAFRREIRELLLESRRIYNQLCK